MKYYNPDTGGDGYSGSDNDPSGAYIFKPMKGDQDKHPYSDYQHIEKFVGENTGTEIFSVYYSSDDNQKLYTTNVFVIPGQKELRWKVNMHGIPVEQDKGMEAVVNWELQEFVNDGVFYTDSNALEMQKRQLNFREDFELVTDEHVSANYYPINSAIAIRDTSTNRQLTIMNDRSQGGSSLADGSIELMQNRRLLNDDWRGVGEALNETNKFGVGIEVDATYYMTLADLDAGETSNQRRLQLSIDEPIQSAVSYAVDPSHMKKSKKHHKSRNVQVKGLKDFDGELKVLLFPEDKGQIVIRAENIADLFDGTPE